MRILHTSDWHIGQRLHGKDRQEEHELFFDWLLNAINEYKVDVLIVAGDIFDVSYPSNSSLQIYYQLLTRLQASYCTHVVIIGGNHDSASTLNAPAAILQFLNVHIVGGATKDIQDEIIEIKKPKGEIELVIAAVPFLRDRDIRTSIAGESYEDRINATKMGLRHHYEMIADITETYSSQGIPVIATGHLYTSGATCSDSEREIHIGNLSHISSADFPSSFQYIALGHIHRPQKIGGNDRVRYSGSPIPLSFSERSDNKIVILINASKDSDTVVNLLPVPTFRKLLAFSGPLPDVLQKMESHQKSDGLLDWSEVIIHETYQGADLISDFEKSIENIDTMEILKYRLDQNASIKQLSDRYNETVSLADVSILDVFERKLEAENITTSQDEYVFTFQELLGTIEY